MAAFIINWCKIMFTQNSGSIRVKTASCQNGALTARGTASQREIISTQSVFSKAPGVRIEENTIFLNRRETSFINKEVQRLLKAKLAEAQRRKKAGIPKPPAPGKISYAVYH